MTWGKKSLTCPSLTNSYASINQSLIALGVACCMMFIIGLVLYFTLHEQHTEPSINHHNLQFWHGLLALAMFFGSSVCNKLISSLTCPPVEILYDQRFTSLLAVQMIGFLSSLHLAFGLGSIFTPLFDQHRATLSRSDSYIPLFSSVNIIPWLQFNMTLFCNRNQHN